MGFVELAAPRGLTEWERAILNALLSREFPGAEVLRQQAMSAAVSGIYDESGDPSVGLVVLNDTVPQFPRSYRVPVESLAEDRSGEPISFLVHVQDGYLFELEVFRLDGEPIERLPTAKELLWFFSPLRGAADAHPDNR